jgi:hypothetical protein
LVSWIKNGHVFLFKKRVCFVRLSFGVYLL